MTSIIADNCYGRGLKCNIMSNFVETSINGGYLSADIEFKNGTRKRLDKDVVNVPFDIVHSVDLKIEHEFYKGDGIARRNYISKRNCYGEHR